MAKKPATATEKPVEKIVAADVIREYLAKYPDMKNKEMAALIAKEHGAEFKAAGKSSPPASVISQYKPKGDKANKGSEAAPITLAEFKKFLERTKERDFTKFQEAFAELQELAKAFGGFERLAELMAAKASI